MPDVFTRPLHEAFASRDPAPGGACARLSPPAPATLPVAPPLELGQLAVRDRAEAAAPFVDGPAQEQGVEQEDAGSGHDEGATVGLEVHVVERALDRRVGSSRCATQPARKRARGRVRRQVRASRLHAFRTATAMHEPNRIVGSTVTCVGVVENKRRNCCGIDVQSAPLLPESRNPTRFSTHTPRPGPVTSQFEEVWGTGSTPPSSLRVCARAREGSFRRLGRPRGRPRISRLHNVRG
jgi:hypothetical protein